MCIYKGLYPIDIMFNSSEYPSNKCNAFLIIRKMRTLAFIKHVHLS